MPLCREHLPVSLLLFVLQSAAPEAQWLMRKFLGGENSSTTVTIGVGWGLVLEGVVGRMSSWGHTMQVVTKFPMNLNARKLLTLLVKNILEK